MAQAFSRLVDELRPAAILKMRTVSGTSCAKSSPCLSSLIKGVAGFFFEFCGLGAESVYFRGEALSGSGVGVVDLCCPSTSMSLGEDSHTIGQWISDISQPLLEARCVQETQHSASHEAHKAETCSWLLMARAGSPARAGTRYQWAYNPTSSGTGQLWRRCR